MQRLWESDHSYYCNEDNYFSSGCHVKYHRWQDFLAEQGHDDMDLNLVFRWDWESPREDNDSDKPIKWMGDENYRDSTLKLFYVGQRKGIFRSVSIDVCRADEPAIREWLQKRWEHMKALWEPLSQCPLNT